MTSRPYLSLIHSHAKRKGLVFTPIITDYLYKVEKGDVSFFMHNVDPGLNSACSFKIASNKSQCYDVLSSFDIPVVEHIRISSSLLDSAESVENEEANRYLEKHKKIVVKPENGGGGKEVHLIQTANQLKKCLKHFRVKEIEMTLSPYMESKVEYRIAVLDGIARIIFGKTKGEGWRHNLSDDGAGQILLRDKIHGIGIMERLAEEVANALGLRYCTVDLFDAENGFQVIEVNTSVFLTHYAKVGRKEEGEVGALFANALMIRHSELQ